MIVEGGRARDADADESVGPTTWDGEQGEEKEAGKTCGTASQILARSLIIGMQCNTHPPSPEKNHQLRVQIWPLARQKSNPGAPTPLC